jgi:hypothetical protein
MLAERSLTAELGVSITFLFPALLSLARGLSNPLLALL